MMSGANIQTRTPVQSIFLSRKEITAFTHRKQAAYATKTCDCLQSGYLSALLDAAREDDHPWVGSNHQPFREQWNRDMQPGPSVCVQMPPNLFHQVLCRLVVCRFGFDALEDKDKT